MVRILLSEARDFSPAASQILNSLGQTDYCELSRQELLDTIESYDVLWVRLGINVDRQVLEAARKLKAVVTPTTGLDHIDVRYAASRDIAILSLQGERHFLDSISATAELTWGLLLSLVRQIPAAVQSVREGDWDRNKFRGHDLKGQTLGIVGLGRLGVQVARFGLAFGMRVVAYDPYQSNWTPGVHPCRTLPELLESSDIVSLHVNLNDQTIGLIGPAEFSHMRPGSILINTARGAIVDGESLLLALSEGRLRGAAMDVVPGERDADSIVRDRLIEYSNRHDNLLITPHIGGATYESMAATEVFMADKLRSFLHNRRANPVRYDSYGRTGVAAAS